MIDTTPLGFGCVGLGGYGQTACNALLNEEETSRHDSPSVRLVAACDNDVAAHSTRAGELMSKGVHIYHNLDDLLADPECEAIWLPVPIEFHRSFTEKSLAAGKAVLCEKPAAGCIDDVDAMITARDRSGKPAAIGFQNVYQPAVQEAKRRIMAGEIGRIRTATVIACVPRGLNYYHRNCWAGAAKINNRWILDSPANNAASHLIHQTLFLLGAQPDSAAQPVEVEAELYRAYAIDNYDTCAMRVVTADGVMLMIYMTHACHANVSSIRVVGDRGTLYCPQKQPIEIHSSHGTARIEDGSAAPLGNMLRGFHRWMRGDKNQIVATLESARMHALIISGASDAGPVHTINPRFIQESTAGSGGTCLGIRGISELCKSCSEQSMLFNESGLAEWTRPAGRIRLEQYGHFSGIHLSDSQP